MNGIAESVEKASARIKALPRDPRGYPVPWFVNPNHNPPDFRVLRDNASFTAHHKQTCWICGQSLGAYKIHVLGPMSVMQKVTSEAACHRECAEFAIQVCPFIANSHMGRSPRGIPPNTDTFEAELANPGLYALWVVKGPQALRLSRQGDTPVFHIPDPVEVVWYKERRLATTNEVKSALEAGYRKLVTYAPMQEKSFRESLAKSMRWLP